MGSWASPWHRRALWYLRVLAHGFSWEEACILSQVFGNASPVLAACRVHLEGHTSLGWRSWLRWPVPHCLLLGDPGHRRHSLLRWPLTLWIFTT